MNSQLIAVIAILAALCGLVSCQTNERELEAQRTCHQMEMSQDLPDGLLQVANNCSHCCRNLGFQHGVLLGSPPSSCHCQDVSRRLSMRRHN